MKPIIESIKDFIGTFPELKDGCLLLVDTLGAKSVEYAVETVPCDPVYKVYADGEKVKQFLFVFASREYLNDDINTGVENLHFYEKFEDWIEHNNCEGTLPSFREERSLWHLKCCQEGTFCQLMTELQNINYSFG